MPKDAGSDPDRLVRQAAGSYRTADDRFEVRESGTGWFVVDSAEANELGQPLMQGPFGTLTAVREALPGARKTKPLRRGPSIKRKASKQPRAKAEPPPPPPPSWIDELPSAEAEEVRGLIRALEREGVPAPEAESLVRRDRDGLLPAVAAQLIEQRLDALVDDLPSDQRERARDLIRRAAEVLTAEGTTVRAPLPRWALVEIGPHDEPPNRRIVIRQGR